MNRICIILFLLIISVSCGRQDEKIDLSEINIKFETQRFDRDLFELNLDTIPQHIKFLKAKYGTFFDIYCSRVINIGRPGSKSFPAYLKDFLTDYYMNQAYKKAQEVFPDFKPLQSKIEKGFKRYNHYFPDKLIPKLYTLISGFNESIVITDSVLGVGLDKYLGRDCDFYRKLQWPVYKRINMYKEKVPSDCIKSWITTEWPFYDSTDNVVSNMIYHGMINYCTSKLLPKEHDTVVFGFTADQLKFCKNNEEQMWTYLIENKLLFNTDYMAIKKLTQDAPYTRGFTRESPGRAGNWIGYRIVTSYMKNNKNVSLADLMDKTNYQEILQNSKYEPK